jgi:hypothetical protein
VAYFEGCVSSRQHTAHYLQTPGYFLMQLVVVVRA